VRVHAFGHRRHEAVVGDEIDARGAQTDEGIALVYNAGADGAASVFMDIVNLPIARRTSHHGAWYAGKP